MTNWTAILHKGDVTEGITIDRSEYPDRVRYEGDRMRWMIGELDEKPIILDYDADKHSGYAPPSTGPAPLPEATRNSMGKPSEGELRWLWTQARATMPEGMCGFNEARHLVDMLFPYAAPPAASAQKGLTDGQIAALVNRFLIWQIPQTVASDLCVTDSTYQFPRSGTNLLNAVEAEAMLRYVLAALLRESEGK